MAREQIHFQETIHAEFKECLEFINLIVAHVDPNMIKKIQIPTILTSYSSARPD